MGVVLKLTPIARNPRLVNASDLRLNLAIGIEVSALLIAVPNDFSTEIIPGPVGLRGPVDVINRWFLQQRHRLSSNCASVKLPHIVAQSYVKVFGLERKL